MKVVSVDNFAQAEDELLKKVYFPLNIANQALESNFIDWPHLREIGLSYPPWVEYEAIMSEHEFDFKENGRRGSDAWQKYLEAHRKHSGDNGAPDLKNMGRPPSTTGTAEAADNTKAAVKVEKVAAKAAEKAAAKAAAKAEKVAAKALQRLTGTCGAGEGVRGIQAQAQATR
ncbi:hypothetical protein FOA52_004463 [Chlamydomonas sp. UWO 241]|nr:hypothetical protein FOA52_004463 [Chlamydomonas sp. UWO 241]